MPQYPSSSPRRRQAPVADLDSSSSYGIPVFRLVVEICWLPIYVMAQLALFLFSSVVKWIISNQTELVGLGSANGIDSTRSLNAPPHDTPSLSNTTSGAPATSTVIPTRSTTAPTSASQTLEFNQFAIETLKQRRPRPASYHGRPSHLSLSTHSRMQSQSQSQGTSVHTGGVRPLQLPIKVASAATSRAGSPRLQSDLALPSVTSTDEESASAQQGSSTLLDSELASSPHIHTAPPARTRFQLEDPGFVPAPLPRSSSGGDTTEADASAPIATRHRRISSQQAFAQQERESLLFRIAELERALQDRERERGGENATPFEGVSSSSAEPNADEREERAKTPPFTEAEDRDSGSRYPSPPASPPDSTSASVSRSQRSPSPKVQTQTQTQGHAHAPRRMRSLLDQNFAVSSPEEADDLEPAHETRVLDEESSSHPKLLLISPTLPPPPRPNNSVGSAGEEGEGVFDDADEVSSPTRA